MFQCNDIRTPENDRKQGTFAVADTLAAATSNGCITIIGGGDSVAAVEQVIINLFKFCGRILSGARVFRAKECLEGVP